MNLDRAKSKDIILRDLSGRIPTSYTEVSVISTDCKLNYLVCHACCLDMVAREDIEMSEADISTPRLIGDYLVRIKAAGTLFLQEGSTYEAKYEAHVSQVAEEKRQKDLRLKNLEGETELLRRNLKTYNTRFWIAIITVGIVVLGLLIPLGIKYYQSETAIELDSLQNPPMR